MHITLRLNHFFKNMKYIKKKKASMICSISKSMGDLMVRKPGYIYETF